MVGQRRAAGRTMGILLVVSWLSVAGCAGPRLAEGGSARMGRVYCMRGLIDVFSLGLNGLAARLRDEGVAATAMSGPLWRSLAAELARPGGGDGPLVLIGHSYGAANAVRASKALQASARDVDLLVLLDATAPPAVPDNVKRCVHYYRPTALGRSNPTLFAGNPVVLEEGNRRTELINAVISPETLGAEAGSVGHFNVDASRCVHDAVVREVLAVCPPRNREERAASSPEGAVRRASVGGSVVGGARR